MPVDPYGVISRGIMEMRVENGDASIMRVKVGKSIQKNDHCEDDCSYVSQDSNKNDKQCMPDNNTQNTQTQKKKVI